ncbi:hypothetical protein MHI57_24900 [Cytobacillus sp. FSL K6-0129]|uniref:hypothetical protein n=1 Tax=Cytobacillus sp. FSL K6-0129 TaxID=2921421 RepID=UPI0030FA7270
MISVRGLTTCTPEFHRIAKAAELEAEANEMISHIADEVDALFEHDGYSGNFRQSSTLLDIRNEINDMADGWYEE